LISKIAITIAITATRLADFLYTNPQGQRSIIFDTFQNLLDVVLRNCKTTTSYQFSIMKFNNNSIYDLLLTVTCEQLSNNKFISGYIFKNPENQKFVFPDFFAASLLLPNPAYVKKLDITQFFSKEVLVSNHIPCINGSVPKSQLDDINALLILLTEFFNPSVAPATAHAEAFEAQRLKELIESGAKGYPATVWSEMQGIDPKFAQLHQTLHKLLG